MRRLSLDRTCSTTDDDRLFRGYNRPTSPGVVHFITTLGETESELRGASCVSDKGFLSVFEFGAVEIPEIQMDMVMLLSAHLSPRQREMLEWG